jgi:putative transcriptional regulator
LENANVRRLRFRSLRQKFNVSQRQLSIDLNVSESHIRNIESGRGNPDAKLLFKLAKYFNTTPEYLFPDLAEVDIKKLVKETYCHYYKRSI